MEHSALAIPASPQPWTNSQRAWGLGTRPVKARGWQSGKKKEKMLLLRRKLPSTHTERPRPFPTYMYKQAPTSLCSFGQFRKRCRIWMDPGLSKKAGAGFHSHLAPAPSALSKEFFSFAFNIVSPDSEADEMGKTKKQFTSTKVGYDWPLLEYAQSFLQIRGSSRLLVSLSHYCSHTEWRVG